ncbi:hypothetical protein PV350_42490 [Streptomyces sp. PA03-6a]|nr:hypothetical protein [Streptomyces sp. PA03-6a]
MIGEALGYFAPIMGARRAHSSRSGTPQEINTLSAVTWGMSGPEDLRGPHHMGEFSRTGKVLILFMGPYKSQFVDPRDRIKGYLGTAIHEAAHGLLDYAMPAFRAHFWRGVEQAEWKEWAPPSDSIGHMEALREIVRANIFELEDFRLGASSGLVTVMRRLLASLPVDVRNQHQNESDIEFVDRITRTVAGRPGMQMLLQRLYPLIQQNRRFLLSEQAITQYGATNAEEDLAETTRHLFLNAAVLRERAPRRAAFMSRVIQGWAARASGAAVMPAAPQPTSLSSLQMISHGPSMVSEFPEDGALSNLILRC